MINFEKIDDIDNVAIKTLVNAPLMSGRELKNTVNYLRKLAIKKNGKKNVEKTLDYWANRAYEISLK